MGRWAMRDVGGPALEAARTAAWHHLLAPALASVGEAPGAGSVAAIREAVALFGRIGWPGEPLEPPRTLDETDAALVRRAGLACLGCGDSLARDLSALPPSVDGGEQAGQAARELHRGRLILAAVGEMAARDGR